MNSSRNDDRRPADALGGEQSGPEVAPDAAVYGIAVAARLVGTGPQNLRAYERNGLVEPARTDGGTRLYSRRDVSRLHRITDLLEQGLNLAGISHVLRLEAANDRLAADNDRLRRERRRTSGS